MRRLALPSLLALVAACGGADPSGPSGAVQPFEVHGPGPGGVLALVLDGSTSPSTLNGTDFGTWSAGTLGNPIPPRRVTFELRNLGIEDAPLPGAPRVEVRGAGAARFPVTDLGVDVVAAGAAATFAVGFDGLGTMGVHAAEVVVHLGDRDYAYAVRGETVPTGQH